MIFVMELKEPPRCDHLCDKKCTNITAIIKLYYNNREVEENSYELIK